MTNLKNIVLFAFATFGVAAAQSTPIKITSSTLVVNQVTENGKVTEKLTDGSKALPGQTLEMRQQLQNMTKANYGPVALVQAVSSGVVYQSNRCDMPGVTVSFSTDPVQSGTKAQPQLSSSKLTFSQKPTKIITVKENGVDVKKRVAATPEDYTALRWNLPGLKAGAAASCQIRVKVK